MNYYDLPLNCKQAKDIAQEMPYNLGTALCYIIRAGKKPDNTTEKDIQKAINHLQFELERLQKKQGNCKNLKLNM